jgi:hypothetical protein
MAVSAEELGTEDIKKPHKTGCSSFYGFYSCPSIY